MKGIGAIAGDTCIAKRDDSPTTNARDFVGVRGSAGAGQVSAAYPTTLGDFEPKPTRALRGAPFTGGRDPCSAVKYARPLSFEIRCSVDWDVAGGSV